MTSKPPTFAYLNASKLELQQLFQTQDIQIREARRIREMSRPALEGCDEKYRLVDVDPRDPAVADESFRVQAANTLNRPKLALEHRESDVAASNADLRTNWTEKTLWTCGTRGQGQDTAREIMDAALNDGGGWSKIVWSKDLWDASYKVAPPTSFGDELSVGQYNRDRKKGAQTGGPPFHWLSVDPLVCYPTWGPDGTLREMLEVTQVPLHRALRDYRLGLTPNWEIVPDELGQPMALNQVQGIPPTVTRLEWWDQDWHAVAIASTTRTGGDTGIMVKGFPFEHHYEFGLPYDFAPGLWMSHWKNRKVGWGIAMTKQWLVAYRSYLRAMHAQYVARDLLSPLHRQLPPTAMQIIGLDGLPLVREEGPEPGWILNGVPGETLQPIQYPAPATLEKHITMIDAAIERLESPRVTTLEGLEGAGFAISQVLAFDLVRFGPITSNVETLLKRQTQKLWSLVRNQVREVIYVESWKDGDGYLGLGPDDLVLPVGIQWTITPERATDDLIRSRAAHERLQAGTLDVDSVIEYLGGQDEAWRKSPDEVRRGKARDMLRQSPWYQNALLEAVAGSAGRGDLLEQAQQALQAAQGGALPGQGPGQAGLGGVLQAGGSGVIPDAGALAMSPNGRGAVPGNGNRGTPGQSGPPQNGMAGALVQGLSP